MSALIDIANGLIVVFVAFSIIVGEINEWFARLSPGVAITYVEVYSE
jgi:hypothetical protein